MSFMRAKWTIVSVADGSVSSHCTKQRNPYNYVGSLDGEDEIGYLDSTIVGPAL
jgi:hypothetical protein